MSGIEFVNDLPPARRRAGAPPWGEDIAPYLRARPGQWAIVARAPRGSAEARRLSGRAATITYGGSTPWRPKGAYRAAQRVTDGEVVLYARYVGEPAGE